MLVPQAGESALLFVEVGAFGSALGDEGIYNDEDIDKAQVAITAFEIDHGAIYPKAVTKSVDDMDVLLEFYKYPAEH